MLTRVHGPCGVRLGWHRYRPAAGFSQLQGYNGAQSPFRLELMDGGGVDRFPTAQTCFNTLRLQNYSSEHQLRERLVVARNQA
jgi:hypothetical protein